MGTKLSCVCGCVRVKGALLGRNSDGQGTTMAFAGEAERASCGERNLLRLQQQRQGVGCLVGRAGSISPGCHRGRTLWNHNGAEWNNGVATVIATIYCLLHVSTILSALHGSIHLILTLVLEG